MQKSTVLLVLLSSAGYSLQLDCQQINNQQWTITSTAEWIETCGINSIDSNAILPLVVKQKLPTEVVALLLDSGAKVDVRDKKFGNTALYMAAWKENVEVATLLIEKGANVNAVRWSRTGRNTTPLMTAAFRGDKDVAALLIENGADLDAQENPYGWTALMKAVQRDRIDVVSLLIQEGADVNMQSQNKDTALIFAAGYGYAEIVNMLIENGADIDMQAADGYTALMFAAEQGHFEAVNLLIENGADVALESYDVHDTAYDLAKDESIKNMLEQARQ